MTAFAFALHLLNFLYPAAAMALIVTAASRFIKTSNPLIKGFWMQVGANFLCGATVLLAGLLVFGNDGKMATYGALVLASASCAFVLKRAWR